MLLALLADEVVWDVADFPILGVFLIGPGVIYELAARYTGNRAYKFALGLALGAALLLFWINGAVGIIGDDDNDANLMYNGELAIGLIGVIIARLKPRGMARAMSATAGAQVLVFVIALVVGWGFTGPITLFFVGMWLASARLFRQAATEVSPAGAGAED